MKFFFLIDFISSKLDSYTINELHKEDIRMASHLRAHGFKVSNPKYPLINVSEAKTNHSKSKLLSLEDQRMVGHLRDEGWTVIDQ